MSDATLPPGLRFSLLDRAFKRRMDRLLGEKELTGVQFGTLGALLRLEESGRGEISQRDLEQAARVSHPTMTELLKRLEKKGFLRTETSSRDRRFKCVSSTEKAHRLFKELAQTEEETFRWLCRGLSAEQTEALLAATDIMLHNALPEGMRGCDRGT